jgi:hypothetical protein
MTVFHAKNGQKIAKNENFGKYENFSEIFE